MSFGVKNIELRPETRASPPALPYREGAGVAGAEGATLLAYIVSKYSV